MQIFDFLSFFYICCQFRSSQLSPTKILNKKNLNSEKQLIDDLLKNYKVKFGRPVNNMNEKVVVYFGIYLIQLIDLKWKDNGLKWNKSMYGNIDDVRLPVDLIWTPDIVLFNFADARLEEKREVMITVKHDGTVIWRPPSIFKSTCQINIQKFPYDQQNCPMKFGSWTYNRDSIDIQFYEGLEEINRNQYTESNEWDIISAKGIRSELKYECCKEIFPDITFYLKMKRKGGFYNYILVLPCVLLSFLTTILFWLPPESAAKTVLGMNIFTSFFVLLLLLSKNVPSASDKIPVIGAYYCLNMIIIATSTFSCTAVVHIFYRGQGCVPNIIRKIFLEFLASIFCMTTPSNLSSKSLRKNSKIRIQKKFLNPDTLSKLSENRNILKSKNDLNYCENKINRRKNLNNSFQLSQMFNSLNKQENNQNIFSWQNSDQEIDKKLNNQETTPIYPILLLSKDLRLGLFENDIKEIRDYLRHTKKKIEVTDGQSKQVHEWKQLALVFDRALFFIHITCIIASFVLMFPRSF